MAQAEFMNIRSKNAEPGAFANARRF
jgi:hypothetical protein